jgi:glycosyltransferase involved in cell wall biosynthesis
MKGHSRGNGPFKSSSGDQDIQEDNAIEMEAEEEGRNNGFICSQCSNRRNSGKINPPWNYKSTREGHSFPSKTAWTGPVSRMERFPSRKLRIAQVAPLIESVPPKLYGGTERVVSYLTDELCGMGHEVTLYASGDSITRAKLKPMCAKALRLDRKAGNWIHYTVVMIEKVFADAAQYDLIHFHIDTLHYPMARSSPVPVVTTLHGRLDQPDFRHLAMEFRDLPVTSISEAQRAPLPGLNWRGTVHHGLPEDLYPYFPVGGRHLVFLGRISPEKGVDRAIAIALGSGIPLKIAAKVDDADRRYYHEVIEPLLDHPLIECIGEVGEGQKGEFLGRALALLMPIDWPEPFGLVMIEALACGTPVIAFGKGSVPEVVEHGRSGFIAESVQEAVEAVHRSTALSRSQCRAAVEERFSARRMAEEYVRIYRELIVERTAKPQVLPVPWKESSRSTTSIIS